MSYHYIYAQLGQSCQVSMDALLDNTKFFPINDPIYSLVYTKMDEYPAVYSVPPPKPDGGDETAQAIKTQSVAISTPQTCKSSN